MSPHMNLPISNVRVYELSCQIQLVMLYVTSHGCWCRWRSTPDRRQSTRSASDIASIKYHSSRQSTTNHCRIRTSKLTWLAARLFWIFTKYACLLNLLFEVAPPAIMPLDNATLKLQNHGVGRRFALSPVTPWNVLGLQCNGGHIKHVC